MFPKCKMCGGYKYPSGYVGDIINGCSCFVYNPLYQQSTTYYTLSGDLLKELVDLLKEDIELRKKGCGDT